MNKLKRKAILFVISLFFLSSIILTTTNIQGRFGSSAVYGYVRNGKGNGISSVLVEAYIFGMREGSDTTNTNGYYYIDLGPIFSKTYVTLKFTPVHNYKAKQVSVTVYPDQTKRKDVTLTQFLALLIAGSAEARYSNDAIAMQETLIDNYDFDSQGNNIYLLTTFNRPERDRETTVANFNWAAGQINSKSSTYDHVYIYLVSHGTDEPGPEVKMGYTEMMTASDFDDVLDTITCKYMYIYFCTCYSGLFIDYLNDEQNRAIYTSCGDELSRDTIDYTYWGRAVVASLTPGSGEFEKAEEADTNDDYKVSLYEIYLWAYDYVDHLQTPQPWIGSIIGSDTNDFIGDEKYN